LTRESVGFYQCVGLDASSKSSLRYVSSISSNNGQSGPLARSPRELTQGPQAAESRGLFRYEVLAARQSQWLGNVLLVPRLSHRVFTGFALLSILGILLLTCLGTYTRKVRVSGWLLPDLGLIRVVPQQPGVISELYVRDGDKVIAGTPLFSISTEVETQVAGATREQVVHRLREQRASLIAERSRQQQLFDQQIQDGATKLAALEAERDEAQRGIEVQQSRVQLAAKTQAEMRELRNRQLITAFRLQGAEQDNLDQTVKLKEYQRNLAAVNLELVKMRGEFRELPLRRDTQLGLADRNIAAIEQQLAEAEARRETIMTAPQPGTVTAVQLPVGTHVNTTVPVLSILPEGARLQAQLFGPSRAIGFVHAKQRVMLRYEAFPYQKFGFYEGEVVEVSRAPLSPAELPQQLTGLSSVYGSNEPLYQITVALAKQTATAYGQPVALQPGMQLAADVLLESRTLLEWALDPLFTLAGGQAE
jgi:membrane fusion protein